MVTWKARSAAECPLGNGVPQPPVTAIVEAQQLNGTECIPVDSY